MIATPFRFETKLSPDELQKLALLSLRWSLTDHILGNCLKVLEGKSDEEANESIFKLRPWKKMRRIGAAMRKDPRSPDAEYAAQELQFVMPGLWEIRNAVAHAVIMSDGQAVTLEYRWKDRVYRLAQIFDTEALTNYAAHLSLVFRYALGEKDPAGAPGPLPGRPQIPVFLEEFCKGQIT